MAKRMLISVYSCSDSDSDDECLMQLAKKRMKSTCDAAQTFNINPQNSLCRPSQESCEFCDSTFINRLEALVHNAKHIIIPLLRNSAFNNHEKDSRIENHNKSYLSQIVPFSNNLAIQEFNNKIILGNKNKAKPIGIKSRIVFEDDDVISISDSDNDVNTDAERPQTKLTKKDVLSNFVADCKVVLSDSMILFNNDAKDMEKKSQTTNENENKLLNSFTAECTVALGMGFEIETMNTQDGEKKILTLKRKKSTEKKTHPIENRTQSKEVKIVTVKKKESIEKITHQFENMCLPLDKNKGNKVESRYMVQVADLFSNQNGVKEAPNYQKKAMKTQVEEKKIPENERKANPTHMKESNGNFEAKTLPHSEASIAAPIIPKSDETIQESVHYDDLQKPGLYKCDLCKYTFPNRFCIATHKTRHAKVKILKLKDEIKKKALNYCKPCQTYFTNSRTFLHHFSQRHSKTRRASKPNLINTNKSEQIPTPPPQSKSKLILNNISSIVNKLNRHDGESLNVCTVNPICLQIVKLNDFIIHGISRTDIKVCFFCKKQVMECAMVSRMPRSQGNIYPRFIQTRLPALSDIVVQSAPNVGVGVHCFVTDSNVTESGVFAGQSPSAPPLLPLMHRNAPQFHSLPVPGQSPSAPPLPSPIHRNAPQFHSLPVPGQSPSAPPLPSPIRRNAPQFHSLPVPGQSPSAPPLPSPIHRNAPQFHSLPVPGQNPSAPPLPSPIHRNAPQFHSLPVPGQSPSAPPLPSPIHRDSPQFHSSPGPLNFSLNGEVFNQPNALVLQRIVPNESEAECVLGF